MNFAVKILIIVLLIFVWAESAKASDKMIYYERLIFVKLKINQTNEGLFLFDTGASASAVDLKTAERLNLQIIGNDKVEGTAGTIEVKKVKVKSLSFNHAKVNNLQIPAYDLSGVLTPPGMKIDGILGYDFLRYFNVEINFIEETINFQKKSSNNKSKLISIPFSLDNGIPRLNALLNEGIKTEFRLDTGASLFKTTDIYLNITEKVWNELTIFDSSLKPETYFSGSGVGGTVRLPVARIKKLSIGNQVFNAPFVIVQPKAGYFAKDEAVGFVSNNLLEKFKVVSIDYRAKKLKLLN